MVEALVIPLGIIMHQILLDHIRQRSLAQDECLIEGLLLDGAHKPFTAGVEIGTPWWQDDGLHATVLQQLIERLCKFGVPVVQ
jgi:hypothetical protein